MVEAESPAIVESVLIVEEADEDSPIVEVDSVEVVLSVFFFDEQDVVRAIIAMKKNADFVIAFIVASFSVLFKCD